MASRMAPPVFRSDRYGRVAPGLPGRVRVVTGVAGSGEAMIREAVIREEAAGDAATKKAAPKGLSCRYWLVVSALIVVVWGLAGKRGTLAPCKTAGM